MKRIIKKHLLIALVILSLLCVGGCKKENPDAEMSDPFSQEAEIPEEIYDGTYKSRVDEIYEDAYERFMDPDGGIKLEGEDIFDKIGRIMLGGYHKGFLGFRKIGVYVITCSLIIGILMMSFARKNKKVQHTGLFVFIIGIPAAIIVLVFGIGIFNGILLY